VRLPEARSWELSSGASYLNVDLPELGIRGGHVPGGLLVGSTFFAPGLSLSLELVATPGVDASVSRRDLLVTGDLLRGTLHVSGRTASLSARGYLLQLLDPDNVRGAVHPYVTGGVGVAVLPLDLRGTYTSPVGSAEVRMEVTEAVGLWQGGAGLDVRSAGRWGGFVEALALSSFAEPKVRTVLSPGGTVQEDTLRLRAWGLRVGVRCLF
jgi:hypothetical protein